MPSFFPVPSHITTQNLDWALYPETFISNGPFVLEKWNHADQVTLVKNSRYWESNNVKLSGIDFFIVNPDTALQMFENGKLDWIGSPLSTIPSDAIANLKKQSLLQISPFQATYFYRLNTSPILAGKQNPLSDRNLRCALALAIDREAIVSHVLQGGHTPAINLVPPDMGLSQEHSIDGQGKWENLLLEPITISYSNSERNAAIAQAVQQQWEKKLGIQVSLEALEPKIFFQRVSKREFQIAAGSWTADFNDPVNFLEVFKYKEGSTNNTGWENIDYIDLLNRSALCRDEEERRKLFRDAEKILMEHMPIIPIFHFALNYVKKPQLAGTLLSSMGQLDLRSAYIDGSIAAEGNVR
jgi:oligopeptide transport system substrate-binding protein